MQNQLTSYLSASLCIRVVSSCVTPDLDKKIKLLYMDSHVSISCLLVSVTGQHNVLVFKISSFSLKNNNDNPICQSSVEKNGPFPEKALFVNRIKLK